MSPLTKYFEVNNMCEKQTSMGDTLWRWPWRSILVKDNLLVFGGMASEDKASILHHAKAFFFFFISGQCSSITKWLPEENGANLGGRWSKARRCVTRGWSISKGPNYLNTLNMDTTDSFPPLGLHRAAVRYHAPPSTRKTVDQSEHSEMQNNITDLLSFKSSLISE